MLVIESHINLFHIDIVGPEFIQYALQEGRWDTGYSVVELVISISIKVALKRKRMRVLAEVSLKLSSIQEYISIKQTKNGEFFVHVGV